MVPDTLAKKNVGFLHFDAHLDRGPGKFGAFYHSGTYMTMAVEEGLIGGKHVVQFGMISIIVGLNYNIDRLVSLKKDNI